MTEKSTISIEGMSCDHCKGTIEKGVGGLKGVSSIKVNLNLNHAEVQFNPEIISLDNIKKKIVDLGYKV